MMMLNVRNFELRVGEGYKKGSRVLAEFNVIFDGKDKYDGIKLCTQGDDKLYLELPSKLESTQKGVGYENMFEFSEEMYDKTLEYARKYFKGKVLQYMDYLPKAEVRAIGKNILMGGALI